MPIENQTCFNPSKPKELVLGLSPVQQVKVITSFPCIVRNICKSIPYYDVYTEQGSSKVQLTSCNKLDVQCILSIKVQTCEKVQKLLWP